MTAQELMLTSLLGCRRVDLYVAPPVLTTEQRNDYQNMLQRLESGEPLQYILGQCEFMGIPLRVNPSVLIPRPETEILVERVLQSAVPVSAAQELKILDMGTGSGNIAIALAKSLPDSRVTAIDASQEALTLAQTNAEDNAVAGRIQFIRTDMRNFLNTSPSATGSFDIIVSNPPYIRTAALEHLPPDVRQEPRCALDGGEDGLEFYRTIMERAHHYLRPDGFLFLEIGDAQADGIKALIGRFPFYKNICFYPDYTQTDRIVSVQKDTQSWKN